MIGSLISNLPCDSFPEILDHQFGFLGFPQVLEIVEAKSEQPGLDFLGRQTDLWGRLDQGWLVLVDQGRSGKRETVIFVCLFDVETFFLFHVESAVKRGTIFLVFSSCPELVLALKLLC